MSLRDRVLGFCRASAKGTPGEAKKGPPSKKPFVIPGLTRNPELFSPAQRAAKFE
jgi:hypothetical protein